MFIPYRRCQAVKLQRTDVVWDLDFHESLKSETKNNCAPGHFPGHFPVVKSIKIVVATDNKMAVSKHDEIMRCNVQEADERLVLHTLDVSKSSERVFIKIVDSDVVITAAAAFQKDPSIKEL